MESKFEITSTIIGEDAELSKEVVILNRKITWHSGLGLAYEADPKHAQTIIDKSGARELKPVTIPIVREAAETDQVKEADVRGRKERGKLMEKNKPAEEELLDAATSTQYRALAAVLNYLAADRLDLMYAAKECARLMSTPMKPPGTKCNA